MRQPGGRSGGGEVCVAWRPGHKPDLLWLKVYGWVSNGCEGGQRCYEFTYFSVTTTTSTIIVTIPDTTTTTIIVTISATTTTIIVTIPATTTTETIQQQQPHYPRQK